jgi:hypothetical protein
MPVADILAILDGISKGLFALGGACVVLTLAASGLCTMFSWIDAHIGPIVKRVFVSVITGGAMMGGAGALGLWFAATLHL